MGASALGLGFGLTIPPAKYRVQPHHGTDHWAAKLTDADIRAIRVSQAPQKAEARRYGVDPSRISRIRARKAWATV
jgi:hypothetical protein